MAEKKQEKKIEVISYESLLSDKDVMLLDGPEKRIKILEKLYSKYKVLDKVELKGMIYFVVEG